MAGQALRRARASSDDVLVLSCRVPRPGSACSPSTQVDAAVVVVDQHPQLVDDRLADLAHVVQPVQLAARGSGASSDGRSSGRRGPRIARRAARPGAVSAKTTTRSLPCAFAVIIAASAQATSSRAFIACSGPKATPTESVISPTTSAEARSSASFRRAARPSASSGRARREDHGELLAADAADGVRAARPSSRSTSARSLEHLVALAVPADVVDALEVVDVEHQQRDRVVRTAGAVELGAQALVEVAVVVEAGQRVGVREMLEARADLRVVERERGGVAEPARQLELVLVERRVLARRGRCSAHPSASRARSAAR